ncbi:hypothetical protein K432DRAFT_424986 [Lepidopterella palustris CBS 459.81]|uniref:Exocyst complex component SEC5 n=1 Tax=Lepidopterella palustris CBS 459.81 TaxID=1314670 RepID=A0A8E2JG58_9PEZI|nr:hypothetical protein K432DRAFT_424986 [Lepidopterella palustris CBS 459.81]
MEAILQNHYNITTLFPNEWPAEKDISSDEDEGLPPKSTMVNQVRRSKSRFSALDRSGSYRQKLPGTETTRDGTENLVQKDEPDSLGSFPSVVQVLRQRGLPVEDDIKLRNRFLLSSTTFSPSLFLSQVHNDASTDSLLQGLDFLSRSIEKKSASLKILVESNFERFVRAKATIDNVYNEMRDQGREPESPTTPRRPHSRPGSKVGTHGRQLSGPLSPNLGSDKPLPSDKKKNALIKESEYGVAGIKAPLLEVAIKAQEVWGPALGGREKEETLKAILATVEKNRGLFEIAASLQDAIKRKDHEMLVEEYTKARKFADDARYLVENANYKRVPLTDVEVHQVIVTARMWTDVESQIDSFKRDAWRTLTGMHFNKQSTKEEGKPEEHMELISIMLEIGVEENPIWFWLLSRYDSLKNKITATCERSKVEIEILRRHLANGEKPTLRMLATHLRSVSTQGRQGDTAKMDTAKVLEFWDHVYGSINTLLATQGGILGEVIEYWETARSFIDGKAQKNLPVGIDGQSLQHHRLSMDGVRELEKGVIEIINVIREHLFSFFSDPPIEDISLLFSPLPTTPLTPKTPLSAALSPLSDTRFRFDKNNIPPPSPKLGESWEKYAFWPPYANALSGVHYLAKILILIGAAASEMASLRLPERGDTSSGLTEQLKSLVAGVRERCVQAVCAAWNADADNVKVLEDWTRSPERRDLTNMPARFMALESTILGSTQKILYVSEAMSKPGSTDVVVPPSVKLLSMVRTQFVTSLYKTLGGMVENAEKGMRISDDDWDEAADELTVPARKGIEDSSLSSIDASNQSTRLLLTLSSLSTLTTETVPNLISLFESSFSVKLTDESKTIRDVLSQIDSRLFKSYTLPISQHLTATISSGINTPHWAPPTTSFNSNHTRDPSPYVYSILLSLVIVHTEVSTISAPLTPRILKHLFEHISTALITTFRLRERYSLPALMQATLDVEFLAQTLSSYTTEKASATQTDIYQVLDAKTDNEARVMLQNELPSLRLILKRLRESTKGEFACFRRVKRGTVVERPGSRGREG